MQKSYQPTSIRTPVVKPDRPVKWGIGIPAEHNSVGMIAGPYDTELEALENVGDVGQVILLFTGQDDKIAWRWDDAQQCWCSTAEEDATPASTDPLPENTDQPLFSDDQKLAWSRIKNWVETEGGSTDFVLRGYAGTGKTFMMRQLQQNYGYRVVFTAPTNKAAKVLASSVGAGARTTHSALGLKMEQQDDVLVLVASERLPKLPSDTILVVDEASMVSSQLRSRIQDVCKSLGIRVLYVGDPLQLNPVGETRSEVWKLDLPLTSKANLRKVMRFDNQLLQLATDVRTVLKSRDWDALEVRSNNDGKEGVWLHRGRNAWNNSWLEKIESPRDCIATKALAWRNATVNQLNQTMRRHLGFKEVYNTGEIMLLAQPIEKDGGIIAHTDDEFEILDVQRRVIVADDRDVKVWTLSARQTEDDWHLDLNVPINRVLVDDILGRLARKARGQKGGQRMAAWRTFWDTARLFTDVRFGYALTVHRAQGSTYKHVYADQGDILANRNSREAHRCLYVGFTRPTTQLHIV